MSTPWQPPQPCPPDGEIQSDGRIVRVRTGEFARRCYAAPLLAAQMEAWRRPASSVAFPLHPLGSLHLYARAQAVLGADGVEAHLTGSERAALNIEVWRVAHAIYAPGVSIRTALDKAVENGGLVPDATAAQPSDPALGRSPQLTHLAVWGVFQAASAWAAGA